MRYLAIDLGGKRTGLAVGDDESGIVTPLEVVVAGDDAQRLGAIGRVIEAQGPDALVLGLPLNMDGTPGPAAETAKAFAETLHERFKLPVHLADERLSSSVADEQMARRGLTRGDKKARRDALAAATILRDFLDRDQA